MTALDTQSVPRIGEPAPDFTLPSTGGSVTLSSLRGQSVLLAFFPLAFTGTCTSELCEMRDDHEAFASRHAVVLPISVDSTATLKEYKAKHDMKVDLLSDFKREVSRRYGVLLDDKYYSKRAYFLIDAAGVLRWAHVEDQTSNRRPNAELLTAIDAVGD